MQVVYPEAGEESESLNRGVLVKILSFWVVTIPVTLLAGYFITMIAIR